MIVFSLLVSRFRCLAQFVFLMLLKWCPCLAICRHLQILCGILASGAVATQDMLSLIHTCVSGQSYPEASQRKDLDKVSLFITPQHITRDYMSLLKTGIVFRNGDLVITLSFGIGPRTHTAVSPKKYTFAGGLPIGALIGDCYLGQDGFCELQDV